MFVGSSKTIDMRKKLKNGIWEHCQLISVQKERLCHSYATQFFPGNHLSLASEHHRQHRQRLHQLGSRTGNWEQLFKKDITGAEISTLQLAAASSTIV